MPRLIDADELKMCIRTLAKDIARVNGGVDDVTMALKEAYDMVDEAPTIDAEPVRHGRWEYQYNDSICSACGYVNRCEPITRYRNDSPYCPKCGAKMDGGKDNDCE